MVEFNSNGGLEISPGPRGHSITGWRVSPDGTVVYFQTDKPGELNGMPLPIGPRGPQGIPGDPGEARIRVDETVGYRVFLWDAALPAEQMVYGDTGVWTLPGGGWVRRTDNVVQRSASSVAPPAGFAPVATTTALVYTTGEAWPAAVTGTITTAPVPHRGLEGFSAAVAQGYPGTAEEWMNMIYRVVLPPAGTPGQFLQRTAEGSGWRDLPRIGPGPWHSISLANTWVPETGQVAQVRVNNGTVEMVGNVTYVGPITTAGIWGYDFVRIGNLPPAFAPDASFDMITRVFKGLDGPAGTPTVARIDVDMAGNIFLGALDIGTGLTLPVKANITKVNLGALPSFPLRNSSTGL